MMALQLGILLVVKRFQLCSFIVPLLCNNLGQVIHTVGWAGAHNLLLT